MSHFLDRLMFFKKNVGTFSGDHGVVTNEDRTWEQAYRGRWAHDRVVKVGFLEVSSCDYVQIQGSPDDAISGIEELADRYRLRTSGGSILNK